MLGCLALELGVVWCGVRSGGSEMGFKAGGSDRGGRRGEVASQVGEAKPSEELAEGS